MCESVKRPSVDSTIPDLHTDSMFTGIIQHMGRVAKLAHKPGGVRISIDPRGWRHTPEPGESIAVNGCCLTVTRPPAENGGMLDFDAIAQTLSATALGELAPGDQVNLEHALRADSLLGGHIVQGHIDGVGRVDQVLASEQERRLSIVPPPNLLKFICEKGSVAVNGVSLTVASVNQKCFTVALIPTTMAATNLKHLTADSRVNLEVDYLARIAVNWLEQRHEIAPHDAAPVR